MAMLRAFIAIELSDGLKKELSRIQEVLKQAQADVKWVTPSNLHITLKFLGNIQEEKIAKINQIIKNSSISIKPFTIALENLGAFPRLESPRVIWVDTTSFDEKLKRLSESIETGLVSLKFPKEKRGFKSHITLGRIRSTKNRGNLSQLLKTIKVERQEMTATKICLFKSTLTSRGPVYESLFITNL